MKENSNRGKIWIIVLVTVCLFCWEWIQAVLFSILYIILPFPFQMIDRLDQYMTRLDYRELLSYIDQELPEDLKLSWVEVDHEQKTFSCQYEIHSSYDHLKERIAGCLPIKELAERALYEVGGVPKSYEIRIVLQFGSPGDRIIFSNTADEDRAREAGGERFGGYQLIQMDVRMPCNLSSLSELSGVQYLFLDNTVIDDLSGLENLGDLIYLYYYSALPDRKNAFTEDEVLSIKQMYPVCRIKGYQEKEPEEPYPIDSLQAYQRFACHVEAGHEDLDAVLMTDLDLETWPYTLPSYDGCFEGNGYTIFNSTKEMIGKLGTEGRVEDLNLEQVQITEAADQTGAVAAYNYGEILDCQVSGYIKGAGYAGGIAGINCGLIENCRNRAAVVSGAVQKTAGDQKYEGYGAGGIAGYCGTSLEEGEVPKECGIVDCVNEGAVSASGLAAGICSRLEDRTDGMPPVNSVQELVEDFGFGEREPGEELPVPTAHTSHYAVRDCKNYGKITAESRWDDDAGTYTQAAGICADLYRGSLYHCANLGTVQFAPDAPDRSEDGGIYANQPMAIAGIMGFAPVEAHHIVDCVSLQGTIGASMRHENIMEISMEQLPLWEEGDLPYISNNWRFDLEETVKLCELEPLGIEESELSGDMDEIYLCREFLLKLPEGFVIREMESDGICYGLQIRYEGKDEAYSDYETWLIRKTADMEKALEEIRGSNSPEEWRMQKFVEEIYDTLPASHIWNIDSINLPFSACYSFEEGENGKIYLKDGLSFSQAYQYMWEGDHFLGNQTAMLLEGNQEDGLEAKWIFVFTNHVTNIRPSINYIQQIEDSFSPLNDGSICIQAEPGDSLWKLAEACTGDGTNYLWLADQNHRNPSDPLHVGELILLPDSERWLQRQELVHMSYLYAPSE